MELMEHQLNAVENLRNGNILWGALGRGKSAAALGYYMKKEKPRDIYVITTAKKRDSLDWLGEAAAFGIGTERDATLAGTITVDSWNNIKKYKNVYGAFFIFDEQRLVGHGAWVKAFLNIARKNHWILLSATPGDTWLDYAPVFIANGFYDNITDFKRKHVIYEPFVKYPKIRGYINEVKLDRLRNRILVEMPYFGDSKRETNWMDVGYDMELFRRVYRDRWNVYENEPIKDAAELFRLMRQVVNSDRSRLEMIMWLLKMHPRLIVYYNFNYELEILRTLADGVVVAEWNGHKKDQVPETDRWVYLVQYQSGSEGWNCTDTDAMVLYSLTYSFKNHTQAMGRIDRMNTSFDTLYYYIFVSNSLIDRGIRRSLDNKKSFNEREFMLDIEHFETSEDDKLELCEENSEM